MRQRSKVLPHRGDRRALERHDVTQEIHEGIEDVGAEEPTSVQRHDPRVPEVLPGDIVIDQDGDACIVITFLDEPGAGHYVLWSGGTYWVGDDGTTDTPQWISQY